MRTSWSLSLALLVLSTSTAAAADIATRFDEAQSADSAGGATITDEEVAAIAAGAETLGADTAVLGIAIANRVRGAYASDDSYTLLVSAFRQRVRGLAVSQMQAPGFRLKRSSADADMLFLLDQWGDPRTGAATFVSFAGVDVVYSWDGWATTHAVSLVPRIGGYYAEWVAGIPATGRLEYAIHLWGSDGRDFWLNNGRDLGIYGGTFFQNYSLDLWPRMGYALEPSLPAFAQLVSTFVDPRSEGGATVTMGELSLLVEQLTWEGGMGVEDPLAIRPALEVVDDLVAGGADAEGEVLSNMATFMSGMMLETATYPSIFFSRSERGLLTGAIWEQDAASATIIYSTDGWNIPHVAQCARSAPAQPLACELGYLPVGTYVAYTIAIQTADGSERWIRSALGNFFHAI